MISLEFLGAAGTVTGSRYLLHAHGRRILIDAGLFQGLKELRLRNWAPFPIEPRSLDAVILTHAHIDHTGFLPSYQAEGTRGRRILDGEKTIKIFGEDVPVRANVRSISSLSAHADADELTIWASSAAAPPRTAFVTHGEPAASRALADRFATRFAWSCVVPTLEETVEL